MLKEGIKGLNDAASNILRFFIYKFFFKHFYFRQQKRVQILHLKMTMRLKNLEILDLILMKIWILIKLRFQVSLHSIKLATKKN